MKYRLSDKIDLKAARGRINYLAKKGALVEVIEVKRNRTLSQNSYLHLLLGAFGLHFGYTIEEAKLIYKQIRSDTYYYKKKGRQFIRSSADLNTEEMAKTIDKFMLKSAEAGYTLPPATNQEWLRQIENEIERSHRYL